MQVTIKPYYRSVIIDGVEVREKILPYPDWLNSLSMVSCNYDRPNKVITKVDGIHRYVSHFIEREYYYEHLEDFIDWYYREKDAQAQAQQTGYLESGVYNVRAAKKLERDYASGELITLPGEYYPTRNILYVSYGGTVCTPSNVGLEGEYQYEEVGEDPNEKSTQIKVLFNAKAGVTLDMWVVTSALGKNLDLMSKMLAETEQNVIDSSSNAQQASVYATDSYNSATTSALYAQQAATSAGNAKDSADKAEEEVNKLLNGFDASLIKTGTIDAARLPAGALDELVTVADDTERFALTTAQVQKGDSVKVLSTGLLYRVVDEANLNNEAGYVQYTSTVDWSLITSKPTVFTPDLHALTHGSTGSDPISLNNLVSSQTTITLADNAGNETLPLVVSGSLQSKIQSLRDNVKALFARPVNTITLSDNTPTSIGTPVKAGISTQASRADHAHQYTMPTAVQVGATTAEVSIPDGSSNVIGAFGIRSVATFLGEVRKNLKWLLDKFDNTGKAKVAILAETVDWSNVTNKPNGLEVGSLIAQKIEVVNTTIPIGSNYIVPSYIVGSNRLRIYFNGTRCYKGAGTYQYTEVGTAGDSSSAVQFSFTLEYGDELLSEVI